MDLRDHLTKLADSGDLLTISRPVSTEYEIAGILKAAEPRPVLFEHVSGSPYPMVGNLLCSKQVFASYFNLDVRQIIPALMNANDHPTPCSTVSSAPCQEVVETHPDLDDLPILRHCALDGGAYISSGVCVTRHPTYGQNLDFHRLMQFSKTEMAVRVVKGRHFDKFLEDLGSLDVAICIGVPPHVLAAAATSVELGVDELEIANALSIRCLSKPLELVHAHTVDLYIPSQAEFVLEGTVYRDRRHGEGPFVDLTGTYDIVRDEPVFVVKAVTHRSDAIWHALLPGALEHKLLMGMPREPVIFSRVSQVVHCLDVNINPGGSSWLHAIVQIDKQSEEDGKKAIHAAFSGHRSCKHVFVVDKDIDIYDTQAVEWAMATRFQGDTGMVVLPRQPGSSLDPSSELTASGLHLTTRVGFDLTMPLASKGKSFDKASFPQVKLEDYLDG